MSGSVMNPALWSVDRYGWTFSGKKPSAKVLAEIWAKGQGTEVSIHIPGKRDLRV